MSVQAHYSMVVTAPNDDEVDQIIRELSAHHQPERETFVSLVELERKLVP